MFDLIGSHPKAVFYSILLHAVVLAIAYFHVTEGIQILTGLRMFLFRFLLFTIYNQCIEYEFPTEPTVCQPFFSNLLLL